MAIVGRLLRGHYKVVSALSGGGVGDTYIALDIDRPGNPQCVVKRLKPSTDSSVLPILRKLFEREAETLERLGHHDRIPRLLAHFEEDKEFYIVQEFIEGNPLNTEFHSEHCWREAKVLQMLTSVLSILQFVHAQGVVHRDIKPANLIRRKDGKLVLIDFGAVKIIRQDSQTQTQSRINPSTISIGTEGYMPPEQLTGHPKENSDIYALGMIAIRALTGSEPTQLQRDGDGEIIWQPKDKVSEELVVVLTRMVRYYFRARYQSVTEALQDLHPLTNHSATTQSFENREPITPPSTKATENNAKQSDEEISSAELAETKVSSETLEAIELPTEPQPEEVGAASLSIHSPTPTIKIEQSEELDPNSQPLLTREKVELEETKFIPNSTPSAASTNSTVELYETKISSDIAPASTPKQASEETKVASTPRQMPPLLEENLRETKVSLDASGSSSSKLAAPPDAKLTDRDRKKFLLIGLSLAAVGVIVTGTWFAPRLNDSNPGKNSPAQESPEAIESVNPDIDYSKLEAALAQRDWERADEETYLLMLKIAGSTSELQGSFDLAEWESFSCNDFRRIDQLWSDASDGELGFTAQNRVYQSVGGNEEDADKYYRAIGWQQPSGDWLVSLGRNTETREIEYFPGKQPNFVEPRVGHLPALLLWSDDKDNRFEKVESCRSGS